MDDIIEKTVSDEEIERCREEYIESKRVGGEEEKLASFRYAYALIKSQHHPQISDGIMLMEELYRSGDQSAKRDYLYYVAIGHTRLKRYEPALDCVNLFLQFEPNNSQATQLRAYIKNKLTKDGLMGFAIAGGAALVLGGLIKLGMSIAKK